MTLFRYLPLLTTLGLLACSADASNASVATIPGSPQVSTPLTMPTGLSYPWLTAPGDARQTLANRSRRRPNASAWRWRRAPGAEWLRWLPLRPVGTSVRLFNGKPKARPEVVAAVVDIDAGTQDLQQCADAVMRLRAEYLFSHDPNKVHFHLTTGYDFWFSDYVAGKTFKVRGEDVTPATRPAEAPTHAALARYLIPRLATRARFRSAAS